MRRLLVVLALLVVACGGPPRTSTPKPAPTRADRTFDARALRQPAVVVRVEVGGAQLNARRATALPSEFEGAVLEGLNARAVPARDVRLLARSERVTPADALARGREVGADHVLMIEARLLQREMTFCRDEKPFRAVTTVWSQTLRVLRVSDGAVAFETKDPIDVPAVEADCDAPRDSKRRSPAEHLTAAVDALLKRLLGS